MGTIWVKEFMGGLDTRRMPVATAGGVLIKAVNGHISRGGEFEKRAAFVPTYTLPTGTVGLAQIPGAGLYVFGSGTTPAGIPAGITYQRLQHPDGVTALVRILSYDLYGGKIYAVAEFADGGVYHFYDGSPVADWFDGRARASLTITGGVAFVGGSKAVGYFEVGGVVHPSSIDTLKVNGTNLFSGSVAVDTADDALAYTARVVAAINSYSGTSGFSATVGTDFVGQNRRVIVSTVANTAAFNGYNFVMTGTSSLLALIANNTAMTGGVANTASQITDLRVNGTPIISAPVSWSTSNEATATALAAAINTYSSTPDYTATAVGAQVNIVASTAGAGPNGYSVTPTTANGLTVSPTSGITLSGGSDLSANEAPGPFVRTVGSKMYSTSGSYLHFSGIDAPTKWTTDTVGAGFIDMAKQSSGSEILYSVGEYQSYIAIFGERVIFVWYVDPDPANNRKVQILKNTGTRSGLSVSQFGDNDLFYLDESGLRSLKARDASNAAATSDIGVPVDTIVTAKLKSLTDEERKQIISLIEPQDGRFWLIMKDTIYVFSFFPSAKVSAWTTYSPTYKADDGTQTAFNVEYAVVHDRRVYVRSENEIYCYGGAGYPAQYDSTVAEAWLPLLDAGSPARVKSWKGVDAAIEGLWECAFAMNPTDDAAYDDIAILEETTYSLNSVPAQGQSTHIGPRFRTVGDGYARLSSVVVHYEGTPVEG